MFYKIVKVKNRHCFVYVERNKETVPEVLNPFEHTEQPAEVAAVGVNVPGGHNVQISSFLTYVPARVHSKSINHKIISCAYKIHKMKESYIFQQVPASHCTQSNRSAVLNFPETHLRLQIQHTHRN